MSVPIFRPHPDPINHLFETHASSFPRPGRGPEPSVHHLDRDEFFDRFDIAVRFDPDPEASSLSIFFRVLDFFDHGLRQAARQDFRDGPVAEDKSDPKMALAGGKEKEVPLKARNVDSIQHTSFCLEGL